MHVERLVAFRTGLYVPEGHGVGKAAFVGQYVPSSHGNMPPVPAVPAGQKWP